MRLLLVEDDEHLASMLRRGLEEEGYEVDWTEDGERGLQLALEFAYHCIILDLMLPERDGLSLCRKLREQGRQQPVIILTAKNALEDKIEGFSSGADDYMVKPFSFEELLARIEVRIRRNQPQRGPQPSYKDLVLDPIERTATREGKRIELTSKEYALLEYLLRNAEQVVTDKQLIEDVWGLSFDPQTNVINVYLHHLRNKIDRNFSSPLIHTIRGKGYRFGDKP